MAKLTRYTQQLFASTAGANQIAKFGSLAASAPVRYSGSTVTPALIQALGNYLQGWEAAQVGVASIAVEDLNALGYLYAYQLSYLMQQGIAEWDSGTTYFIGSLAQDGAGNVYVSKTNSNTNNALTSTTNWRLQSFASRAVSTSGTCPLGGFGLTTGSGSFVGTNNGAGFDSVTNQSISIVCSGNPVMLLAQPQASFNGSMTKSNTATMTFQWTRNVVNPYILETAQATTELKPVGAIATFIDYNAPAGTNTYTYSCSPIGSGQISISGMQTLVYEMV